MAREALAYVLRYLHAEVEAGADRGRGDGELLERYARRREEAAFAALVGRHGPMVLGVCRRVLGREADAEDAFQATFLLLARKAAVLHTPDSVAGWLHGVALRTALAARRRTLRPPEGRRVTGAPADPVAEAARREVRSVLDEELGRLPERFRAPLVLCYLEGRTQEDAARQLGCPRSSLASRLARGRDLLQRRLLRRGVALSAGLVAGALAGEAAAVPAGLASATLHAVALASAGAASPAAALAETVGKALFTARFKTVTAVALSAGLLLAGAGIGVHRALSAARHDDRTVVGSPPAVEDPGPPRAAEEVPARVDRYGDPLPPGALARLGTTRWCLDAFGAHCMMLSADGQTLYTANPVTGVGVWEMATGRLRRLVPADPNLRRTLLPGSAVALSADARTAALGLPNGKVTLLDLETGEERRSWRDHRRGHQGKVEEAVLSADARTLVTRSADGTLRVWDGRSGNELGQAPIHGLAWQQIRRIELALSPDGKTLAWVGDQPDLLIHVCDTLSGQELDRLGEHKGLRRRIAISPDGQKLLATSDGGPGQVWDLNTGKLVRELPFWRKDDMTAGAFTPDSQAVVLTVCGDGMRIVDLATGKERWHLARRLAHSELDVYAFDSRGKTLVVKSLAVGQPLQRYDATTGQRLPSPQDETADFRAVAFAPDEKTIYSLGDDGTLRTWEAETGKLLSQTPVGTRNGSFSPDGRLLAVTEAQAVHLFEAATGKERWRVASDFSRHLLEAKFSGDGAILAVPRGAGLVLVEVATGREISRVPDLPEQFYPVALTSSPTELIGHAGHPMMNIQKGLALQFREMPGGRERRTLSLPEHFGSVVLAPDGKMLAVPVGQRKEIDLLEAATAGKRIRVDPPTIWPCALGFSPDGRCFLVSDQGGSVRYYDAEDGRLLLRREGHRGNVLGWAFSPTGRKLATLSEDRTVLVWPMTEVLRGAAQKPSPLGPTELPALWACLAGGDAGAPYQAIRKLAEAPQQVVPWLADHLQPPPPIEPDRVRRLIADLEDARPTVPEEAFRELDRHRDAAEPALREALARAATPEAGPRLRQFVQKLDDPERLRVVRALEVLERIGSPPARDILRRFAEGGPNSRLGQEAKASLERLARRPAATP